MPKDTQIIRSCNYRRLKGRFYITHYYKTRGVVLRKRQHLWFFLSFPICLCAAHRLPILTIYNFEVYITYKLQIIRWYKYQATIYERSV
jgi:hypothetical protein